MTPLWRAAAMLLHVGSGPRHHDLVLGGGARCPTLRLEGRAWRWQEPHRRRYLAVAGALGPGRGRIERCWRGRARLRREARGWLLELSPAGPAPWPHRLLLRRDGVVIRRV